MLSRISHFLFFLTATSHRGDPESFRLLLDLLVAGMFTTSDLPMESVEKCNAAFTLLNPPAAVRLQRP
ncbi:MAG: hypothetical protein ACK4OK_08615, partial [Thermoflexus sp.]